MTSNLKETLWNAADRLRGQTDISDYKHIVLGLIFLKYISDRFTRQQDGDWERVAEPRPDGFAREHAAALEGRFDERSRRDKDSAFWIPPEARWEALKSKAKQPDIGDQLDAALSAVENANPALQGKPVKCFGRTQLDENVLNELIEQFSASAPHNPAAIEELSGAYEYCLDQFAQAERRRGGHFYTSPHIVKTLVTILSPTSGSVYDPCCGTGGMLVQSMEFAKTHGNQTGDVSLYGQELNPATRQLAAMNLIIHGMDADLGKEPGDTFDPDQDQFPELKFDCIMANPPLDLSHRGLEKFEDDPRWKFGRPSLRNASYAWLQHILSKLNPGGQAGVALDNSSLNFRPEDEEAIRKAMVHGDVVEMIISLPGKVLLNHQSQSCLWFLTNDKTANGRDRRGEILFIDARELGTMETWVYRIFEDADIARINGTVQAWKTGEGYQDIQGFCKSATLKDIEKNDYLIHPGRFVGLDPEKEEVSEPFGEQVDQLTRQWQELRNSGEGLDDQIAKNFEWLGANHD